MNLLAPSFSSFVMGGFECTYARTEPNVRLNMLSASKHDVYCSKDYVLLKKMGIHTVREGLSWSLIDNGSNTYDFSLFEPLLKVGKEENVQQIWDLNHFDYPDYLDPFSEQFIEQFSKYASTVLKVLRKYSNDTLYIVPINEISFFAWIGADKGWWAPFKEGRTNGFTFKQQLVKAAIAAMDAIWALDENVRFIQVDPFMRRLAREPANASARKHVTEFNEVVRFEAWDMLCGTKEPQLGGKPKYLDIIGVNYYIHNQEWVLSGEKSKISHKQMDWDSSDRVSFADMLKTIYDRYQRPMVVTETGSYGDHRKDWWDRTLQEVSESLTLGLPVYGVCIYPTVDRPSDVNYLIPNSGIFDFAIDDKDCERIPHQESIDSITRFIKRL